MVPKTNIKRNISLRPIAYFSFFFGIFNGHSFCNALMTLSEIKSSTLICAVHFFWQTNENFFSDVGNFDF